MEITIDLMDLMLGLLALAGIVLIIYLIVTFARLQQTLKEANRMISDLRGPVNDTVRKLPALMDQVSEIGANVEQLTVSINEDVPGMLEDVHQVTSTARESVDAVGGVVTEVGNGITNLFSSAGTHASSLGAAVGVVSEIVQLVSLFRTPKKKSIFGKRSKRRR